MVEMANLLGQLDGGQKGQEVRLVTFWDEDDKTKSPNRLVCQLWLDLTYCVARRVTKLAKA
jgi:hypothetical protein